MNMFFPVNMCNIVFFLLLQIFIFLHQTAGLVDTTHSLQGYYKTRMPVGHEPDMKMYNFTGNDALEQYWIDLKHFAFSSNLGHKCKSNHLDIFVNFCFKFWNVISCLAITSMKLL